MRRSENLPLPPRIYPPFFQNNMRHSQNLPIPPGIYPPFKHLCATLPESTSPPRIYYEENALVIIAVGLCRRKLFLQASCASSSQGSGAS